MLIENNKDFEKMDGFENRNQITEKFDLKSLV
jgi:hypothetical protein